MDEGFEDVAEAVFVGEMIDVDHPLVAVAHLAKIGWAFAFCFEARDEAFPLFFDGAFMPSNRSWIKPSRPSSALETNRKIDVFFVHEKGWVEEGGVGRDGVDGSTSIEGDGTGDTEDDSGLTLPMYVDHMAKGSIVKTCRIYFVI